MKNNAYDTFFIERLKQAISRQFGQSVDSPTAFDSLSTDIYARMGQQLSTSTLKRIFGYIKQDSTPRVSTLSILARYVEFNGWDDFCRNCSGENAPSPAQTPVPPSQVPAGRRGRRAAVVMIAAAILLGAATVFLTMKLSKDKNESPYQVVIRNNAIPVRDSLEQIYEDIYAHAMAEAKRKCREVLDKYGSMDIISYDKYVKDQYAKIVFTELKNLVSEQTAAAISDEDTRQTYEQSIFSACRDYCIKVLLIDFPKEELSQAMQQDSEE